MAAQFCRWDPELKMVGLRFSNVMEPQDYEAFPGFDADPQQRKWNLWGYIDARDGAQAVRAALEAEFKGSRGLHHRQRRHGDEPVERRADGRGLPGRAAKGALRPNDTLLSIDKARKLLDYKPQHSWRSE